MADLEALVSNWWDEINESTRWQDGIFYTLCALYALVSSVALVTFSLSLENFISLSIYSIHFFLVRFSFFVIIVSGSFALGIAVTDFICIWVVLFFFVGLGLRK
jgi:hypothetical protein